MELTFITGNEGKAKYLSEYFHMPIAHRKLDLPEIQSLSLREVAEDKARRAYDLLQAPVLVEDVSLTFSPLAPLPGPLIKWFFEALGNDGLCKLLDPYEDRSARAEVLFALCDGTGVHTFDGSTDGAIARTPDGEQGFGWDPIFVPTGYDRPWAALPPDDKHRTSMRRVALEKLSAYLHRP